MTLNRSRDMKDGVRVYWSKREKDFVCAWDREFGSGNPRYILHLFPKDVIAELDRRGYDTETLRFSIKKKTE